MREGLALKQTIYKKTKKVTDDYLNGCNTFIRTLLEADSLASARAYLAYVYPLLQLPNISEKDVARMPVKKAEWSVLNGLCSMAEGNLSTARQQLAHAEYQLDTVRKQDHIEEWHRLRRLVVLKTSNLLEKMQDSKGALLYLKKYQKQRVSAFDSPARRLKFYAVKMERQSYKLKNSIEAKDAANLQLKQIQKRNNGLSVVILLLLLAVVFAIYRALNSALQRNLLYLGVYHDLRNPAGKIRKEVDAALESEDPEWMKGRFNSIKNTAGYLENLASTLLLYQKKDLEFNISSHNLYECCNDAIRQIQSAKGISIEIVNNIPPEAQALFDDAHLTRVFMNLISNAMRAIDARNDLLGSARIDGIIEITYQEQPDGKTGVIEVKDNGIGLIKGAQSRHLRQHSTGVGLKYCHLVMKKHEGGLTLADNPLDTSGACAKFSLPLASNAKPVAPIPPKPLILDEEACLFIKKHLHSVQKTPFYRYTTIRKMLGAALEKAPNTACKTALELLIRSFDRHRQSIFEQQTTLLMEATPNSPLKLPV
jgi:signal transduction histidine kinase